MARPAKREEKEEITMVGQGMRHPQHLKYEGGNPIQGLPDKPPWLVRKALDTLYKKRYHLAKWLFRIQLFLRRNDYFALCWYANCLYFCSKGLFDDKRACACYERAIGVNPGHPLAHAGLGRLHYTNAKRIMREYAIFPGDDLVMFNDWSSQEEQDGVESYIRIEGFADYECGSRKKAVKELEEAAHLMGDIEKKVEILAMAAEIRWFIDNSDGIKAYEFILTLAPDYIPAHFHLGCCCAATGKRERALKEYSFIKDHAPESTGKMRSVFREFGIEAV